MPRLAHVSDLHLGASADQQAAAEAVVDALLEERVQHVVVTGDLTHTGRRRQLDAYRKLIAPLERSAQVWVVPGNHDRCTDDVGAALMGGQRVLVDRTDELVLIRVDSTAPHNRSYVRSHGDVCRRTLEAIDDALAWASPRAFVVVALHHHVVELPTEGFWEWLAKTCGWGWESELALGTELLRLARGRCDLVLHGHRHVPRQFVVDGDGRRPLRIYNAGSSAELGAVRVFDFDGDGLCTDPQWVQAVPVPKPSPHVAYAPARALSLG